MSQPEDFRAPTPSLTGRQSTGKHDSTAAPPGPLRLIELSPQNLYDKCQALAP